VSHLVASLLFQKSECRTVSLLFQKSECRIIFAVPKGIRRVEFALAMASHKIILPSPTTATTTTTTTTVITATMSRWNIEHVTNINVPIDVAWKALVDIDNWEWNLWTRLDAPDAKTGVPGKLRARYEGDADDWKTFDFCFGEVSEEKHLLAWQGSIAGGVLFSGKHHMRLTELEPGKSCRLEHVEIFSGLLPMLGLGLPYKTLDRNYLLMNEALKKTLEEEN
jgi:hypothetical protein